MKIGFIGLGIMGKPMVRNLLKAGHEVIVYDVINANIKAVITDGAIEAGSSREVAEQCSLIITMLPNSPHVKTVVLGENGVLEGAKEGTILIDMSSIAPYASQEIYKACKENDMYLFIDGARLGYALASEDNDLDLKTIAENCDVFYIGGTKCGAMFGEALVILNNELKKDFRYVIKQKGGMLAKGWLLGIQFDELLKDGLYFELAAHADKMAYKIKNAALEAGYKLYSDSPTNQQFIIFPDRLIEKLSEKYVFSYQERIDENNSAVRICTSWATDEKNVDMLIKDIKEC